MIITPSLNIQSHPQDKHAYSIFPKYAITDATWEWTLEL